MASPDRDRDNEEVKVYQKGDFNKNSSQKSDRQRWKNANFIVSLEFAITGILTAIKEEKNMRKHLLASLLIIVAGFIFRVSLLDWVLLALAVGLVIMAELFNSAIENVVDLASDYNFHMRAKRAKDMAAGAVLVISGFAIIVGLYVFLPKIWHLIFR